MSAETESGDYVVLSINCTRGKFRAFGLFATPEQAEDWIDQQEDQSQFSTVPLEVKA